MINTAEISTCFHTKRSSTALVLKMGNCNKLSVKGRDGLDSWHGAGRDLYLGMSCMTGKTVSMRRRESRVVSQSVMSLGVCGP